MLVTTVAISDTLTLRLHMHEKSQKRSFDRIVLAFMFATLIPKRVASRANIHTRDTVIIPPGVGMYFVSLKKKDFR
jgi:hypothetical protein